MENENKNIGILTWHYYKNFGSTLQAYALQTLLESYGCNVRIINYRSAKFGNFNSIRNRVKRILATFRLGLLSKRLDLRFVSFQQRFLKQTQIIQEPGLLPDILGQYDTIVFGSDQIWAPNVLNDVYLGKYVPNSVKKVSYAASIGLEELPQELENIYREALTSFSAISVREHKGQEIVRNICGVDATVVLDPTLMLNVEQYKTIESHVSGVAKPFIFCYFLNNDHKYKSIVLDYAQRINVKVVGVSENISDEQWLTRLTGIGADQFLWLIHNASVVITDSYHGGIFSLLYHKKLWLLPRFCEDSPICQNSRIEELINNFHIHDRLLTSNSEIPDQSEIDYLFFEKSLTQLRGHSRLFLEKALSM